MRALPPVVRFERCCWVVSETTILTGGWGLFYTHPQRVVLFSVWFQAESVFLSPTDIQFFLNIFD